MARKTGSHSQITGPRIRKAALKLVARYGFAAVSMRQIASAVGVQAGALYLYTPDKQTLLYDMMRTHLEELLQAWADEPKGNKPLEQLEAFSRFHIRFHLERADAVFVANMEMRNLEPENFVAIEELRGRYEKGLADILENGAMTGEFKLPDARLAAMAIISMLTGVNTWYREGGRLSRERVERIYWNMIRRSVGS